MSDDSTYLYVYNSGAASISRIALTGFTSDIQIPLAPGVTLNWLAVVPGSARSIATIQTTSAGSPSMIVYDDAKTRASTVSSFTITRFIFTDAQTIVAGSSFQGSYLTVWKLSSTAVTFSAKVSGSAAPDYPVATADGLVLGFSGNLYDTLGRVPTHEADYGGVGTFVPGQHRWIVGVGNGSIGALIIGAFDERTMTPLGRFTISGPYYGFSNPAPRILTWGADGVAFISSNQLYWWRCKRGGHPQGEDCRHEPSHRSCRYGGDHG